MARKPQTDKIWNNVDKALELKGESLLELAENAGISYDTLRGWRTKHVYPQIDDAKRMAEAMEMTIEQLFFDIKGDESTEELIRKLNDAECVLSSIRKLLEIKEDPC